MRGVAVGIVHSGAAKSRRVPMIQFGMPPSGLAVSRYRTMKVAQPLVATLALALAFAVAPLAVAADPAKVLRIALPDITSLDPQQGTDLYSTRIASAIFEGLYQYDYLSSPAKIIPNTAAAMPEIGDDGRTWTIRLQKGIRFTDNSAFSGKPRELVAEDYVYSIKRWLDPNLRGGGDPQLTDLIVGARPIVDAARKPGGKLDYDAPIAGLRAIDRHTLQLKLAEADYTLLERLASLNSFAVAREAIEAAGNDVMTKPVGTGPYRLKEWKRASRVVLEANPHYRTLSFPDSADPAHRALVQSMKGVKLPAIGRIEISIIEEQLPELLAFDRGELDYIGLVGQTVDRALVDGKLRPEYAARGIQHVRSFVPALIYTYFNMDDPVVGGYAPERVALRRAIGMGFNTPDFIRVLYAGQAIAATQLLPPGVVGHDASLDGKSSYDPAAARALLDRFGYKDRDGDGFRETPDGKPLVLTQNSLPDSWSREMDSLWLKSMQAIGLKIQINTAPFADLLKQSLAGQLQMFNLGIRSLDSSGYQILQTLWGQSPPDTNRSRFRLADYDRAYEAFVHTAPGAERIALVRKMSDLVQAYAPLAYQVYPIGNSVLQPWVKGFYQSPFGFSWKYLDIDRGRRAKPAGP
jgi:ABC-type transport system substrate-binding protein